MRRAFIFVMLGIISSSMFCSMMSTYFPVDPNKVLLDTVAGAVGAGNFSYWHLGHMGPLLVELTSITGDADLYVADNVRPGYELDEYNFSSTTCGPDIVSIPADFPRPIGVGVFGHWSYSFSEYSIQVFLDRTPPPAFQQKFQAPTKAQMSGYYYVENNAKNKPSAEKEDEPPSMARILTIMNLLLHKFVF